MARPTILLLFVVLVCAHAFVAPATPGAKCMSRPTCPGNGGRTTAIDAIPSWGGEMVADGVVSSTEGVTSIWLAATGSAPDTYVATGLFGIAASVIVVGAGSLVASVVLGDQGIGAFLSKEKRDNPFYKDGIAKLKPNAPEFMNKIRLPELDFVEVYNQPERATEDDGSGLNLDSVAKDGQDTSSVVATAESLRERLIEAVQTKDYALASTLERELASFMLKNGMSFEDDSRK